MEYLIANADKQQAQQNAFRITKFSEKVRNAEYNQLLKSLNVRVI